MSKDLETIAKAHFEQYCSEWFYSKASWDEMPENVRQRWRDRARAGMETPVEDELHSMDPRNWVKRD